MEVVASTGSELSFNASAAGRQIGSKSRAINNFVWNSPVKIDCQDYKILLESDDV